MVEQIPTNRFPWSPGIRGPAPGSALIESGGGLLLPGRRWEYGEEQEAAGSLEGHVMGSGYVHHSRMISGGLETNLSKYAKK